MAIGWFVSQYPVRIRAPADGSPISEVSTARDALGSVPNQGIGYALLRARPEDDSARVAMESLARPRIYFQYRGNIDDAFRKKATFPVIGVHHEGRAYLESRRRRGDMQPIAVMAGLSKGTLYWSVSFDAPERDIEAQALMDGIQTVSGPLVKSRSLVCQRFR